MNARERWLTAGLVVACALLVGLFLTHQARYADARRAISGYLRVDERLQAGEAAVPAPGAETGRPDEPDEEARAKLALLRQARPELRRQMISGLFRDAVRRLDALEKEEAEGVAAENAGRALAVSQLWPPGSAARGAARRVLTALSDRQRAGYDLSAAREALAEVAERARAGRKADALKSFSRLEGLIQGAPLRPGFQQEAPAEVPGTPLGPGGFGPGGRPFTPSDAQVQQFLRFLQIVLPQMIQQAPPEIRPTLERLQSLGTELVAAYKGGKDLRPSLPLLRALGQAIQAQEIDAAEKLMERVRAQVRAAPQRRPGELVPPLSPLPSRPGGAPAAPDGRTPPSGAQVVGVLDQIRTMSDAEYRAQRDAIAGMVMSMLATTRTGGGARLTPVGAPPGPRLWFDAAGRIRRLEAGLAERSERVPPGGIEFHPAAGGSTSVVTTPPSVGSAGVTYRVDAPTATGEIAIRPLVAGLSVRIQIRALAGAPAGAVSVRLPFSGAGWRWRSSRNETVAALGESYEWTPGGADERLTLGCPGGGLKLTAVGGKVVLRPADGALHFWMTAPGPGAAATAEFTITRETSG